MKNYSSPVIEIVEVAIEGAILSYSTGESYRDEINYDGEWN